MVQKTNDHQSIIHIDQLISDLDKYLESDQYNHDQHLNLPKQSYPRRSTSINRSQHVVPMKIDVNSAYIVKAPSKIIEFESPRDKTLNEISSLSDAFGGWLTKISHNSIINSKKLKKRYVVVANCSLYVFHGSDPQFEYSNSYPITSTSTIRVSEKGMYVLEYTTEARSLPDQTRFSSSSGKPTPSMRKVMNFQCQDGDELMLWLEIFRDAIQEAKNGRRPLPIDKRSSSITSPNSSRRGSTISYISNHSTQTSKSDEKERKYDNTYLLTPPVDYK
ncbi:hypothetical protein HK099_003206 [Clydaea vesicula]|uniref:PH domain-containing protein n=1 Tax=Clydaea vesicula TaxID=447962 RepID=A0AAD5Y0E4_9FUNG|nr:hypothetical protein HK099_003206 [Clydaea vesicula]KAJ3390087.1 hypothetical protein HDU92_000679 [Lobulomyces angularis]